MAKVESSQKSNGTWFFRHFFAPYLFDRSRNNRRYKQPSKFWREKNVQKTTFEAAEMILGPWNQQLGLLLILISDDEQLTWLDLLQQIGNVSEGFRSPKVDDD